MNIKAIVLMMCVCAGFFGFGFWGRSVTHVCKVAPPEIKTEIKRDTVTEIVYVPKVVYKDGTVEKTDVNMDIGKQSLAVKVNGKDFEISKTDDEKYVFDKNKLQLTQSSYAELNIKVPTIDKTKRWEIGIGHSKDGTVGMVGFPINKTVGGWVAGRKGDVMIGVSLKI